jgi:hypothetical protein
MRGIRECMPGMSYHVQLLASGYHDKKRLDDAGRKRADVEACVGYRSDRFTDMMHAGAIANRFSRFWAVTLLRTLQTETACPTDAPVVPPFEWS